MKRLHLHVAVSDLDNSISFYSTLFGTPPAVTKGDYAKWLLDDPQVNFAISARNRTAGLDHVGIQIDSRAEFRNLADQLHAAGVITLDEEATTCCYAQSDKAWVNDPSGLRWETFYTFGESTVYGDDPSVEAAESACCASASPQPRSGLPDPVLAACCATAVA